MEEYEKATIEVVEMGTVGCLTSSDPKYAFRKSNDIPDDLDTGFDVIP